jgi:hypothetical protein
MCGGGLRKIVQITNDVIEGVGPIRSKARSSQTRDRSGYTDVADRRGRGVDATRVIAQATVAVGKQSITISVTTWTNHRYHSGVSTSRSRTMSTQRIPSSTIGSG